MIEILEVAAPWTWKHAWPIEDEALSRSEVIAAARPELEETLAEQRIIPVGAPRWRIVVDDQVTWPGVALVLVVEVPALPGLPTREQWPVLLGWAAGQGWTDRTLAGVLGLPETTVRAQRRRAGLPGHAARSGRAA